MLRTSGNYRFFEYILILAIYCVCKTKVILKFIMTMKIRVRLIDCTFLIILLFHAGCGANKAELEEQINQHETTINRAANDNYHHDQYISEFPQSEKAPNFLYNAAMISAQNLQNYNKALTYLDQVRRNYPDSDRREQALFMIGYLYSNELGNYERAKIAYESFMEKYPESELTSSVQFELKHLGKSQMNLDFLGD